MQIREIPAEKMIEKIAEELKKTENVKPHPSSLYVKSGVSVERPPIQKDFWFIRSAALLRKIHLNGSTGVERLRNIYGGRRRRGHKPAHHKKAGGKFIRLMLQQLEKEGLIAKGKKGGRSITPKGQKFLEQIAKGMK